MTRPDDPHLIKTHELRLIYRDLAVSLGGILAVHKHELSHELIWEIAGALNGMFCRQRDQLAEAARAAKEQETYLEPHPAITDFINSIESGRRF